MMLSSQLWERRDRIVSGGSDRIRRFDTFSLSSKSNEIVSDGRPVTYC